MIAAKSSGEGIAVDPVSVTCWAMMPKFLVRMTILSDSMVCFESFEKSLSETSRAFASEWVMIISSSGPEKSGRIGTTTIPADVTAR